MPQGELSQDDVDSIAGAVDENPLFAGRVISPDGKGLAVYVPLESKGDANGVASGIESLVDGAGLENCADSEHRVVP